MSQRDYDTLSDDEKIRVATLRAQRYGVGNRTEQLNRVGLDENVKTPSQIWDDILANPDLYGSVQADWNSFGLQDLPEALLQENIRDTLDTVNVAIDVVREFISILETIVDAVLLLAIDGANLIAEAFNIAILALQAFVDLFGATQVSLISGIPSTIKSAKTLPLALQEISQSYFDMADHRRPTSRSESDAHLFLGLFVTAPTIHALSEAWEVFKALMPPSQRFQYNNIDTYNAITSYPYDMYQTGQAQAPNWSSAQLKDLQPFKTTVDGLISLTNALKVGKSYTEAVRTQLNIIKRRVDYVEQTIQKILTMIQGFIAVTESPIQTLTVYGTGNIEGVADTIGNAHRLATYPLNLEAPVEKTAYLGFHFVLGVGRAADVIRAAFKITNMAQNAQWSENLKTATSATDQGAVNIAQRADDINFIWNTKGE